jgi:hypothetical protein
MKIVKYIKKAISKVQALEKKGVLSYTERTFENRKALIKGFTKAFMYSDGVAADGYEMALWDIGLRKADFELFEITPRKSEVIFWLNNHLIHSTVSPKS